MMEKLRRAPFDIEESEVRIVVTIPVIEAEGNKI